MSTERSVAVVGAEGWLGAAIARALRERLFRVLAIAEGEGPRWHLEDLEMEWVEGGEGIERLPLEEHLSRVQVVVLPLEALEAIERGHPERARRMRRLRSVLEIAVSRPLRVILLSSSATVVERTNSPGEPERTLWKEEDRYCPGLAGRRDIDDLILLEEEAYRYIARGADVVILNHGAPSGPGDCARVGLEYLRRARGVDELVELSFCDVRDVAHGVTHGMVHGRTGRRYLLGAEPLSAREYVQAWVEKLDVSEVPQAAAGEDGADLLWRAPAIDARRARHELGFRPRPTSQSVEQGVRWMRQVGLLNTPPQSR